MRAIDRAVEHVSDQSLTVTVFEVPSEAKTVLGLFTDADGVLLACEGFPCNSAGGQAQKYHSDLGAADVFVAAESCFSGLIDQEVLRQPGIRSVVGFPLDDDAGFPTGKDREWHCTAEEW